MIEFKNVNKHYDNQLVLEDINLQIPTGTLFGVVGRNGVGKSTLLRLCAGIHDTSAGIVTYESQSIFENSYAKSHIFYVGDESFAFPKATIREMKRFYKVFYKNFDDVLFAELLSLLGFEESQHISNFSKGMNRQLYLIIGIAANTPILILDEAFDGLDIIIRRAIRKLLFEAVYEKNKTVIIASHNLHEITDLCDTIAFIDHNSISSVSNKEDLYRQYHRFTLAFDEPFDISKFNIVNVLESSGSERIFSIITKGDKEAIQSSLKALNPRILEHSDLSIEDIFMYEFGGKHNETSPY